MLEFDAGVVGGEVPVGLGVVSVAIAFPGGDLIDEGLFVGDAAIEALGGQDAEFGLGQIEPATVLWRVGGASRSYDEWWTAPTPVSTAQRE